MPLDAAKPLIVPIFLPHHGCPHQCVFCNQTAITRTGRQTVSVDRVRQQIKAFLEFSGREKSLVQIAFYGGNFLGLDGKTVESLLQEAARFVSDGAADGIRFSTRPDTVDEERLKLIDPYPVSTIEIGAQSMDDDVLAASNRGHTASQTQKAVSLLKQRRYETGLQLMIGLPGDDETRALASGKCAAALRPDFVRIYPCLVLAGSPLAERYRNREYAPWTLERSVEAAKSLYLIFRAHHIRVVRMGIQLSQDLDKTAGVLAGPYHPSFGHLVHSKVFLDMATDALKEKKGSRDEVTIRVHPKNISKIRGLNNRNVGRLVDAFKIKHLHILPDASLPEDGLLVSTGQRFRVAKTTHRLNARRKKQPH